MRRVAVGVRQHAPGRRRGGGHRVRRRVRPGGRGRADLAESGPDRGQQPAGRAPAAGHRHPHPDRPAAASSRRPVCTHAATPTPRAASSSADRTLPLDPAAARLRAPMALDGHRAQQHGARSSTERVPRVLGLPAEPAGPPMPPASGWSSTSATVSEDALAIAPDAIQRRRAPIRCSSGRQLGRRWAGSTPSAADRHLQRRTWTTSGSWATGPTDVRSRTGLIWTSCRSANGRSQSAVPVFPWGDLSSRCTRGNGVLDTEDLNGDNGLNSAGPERERLPLRRGPGRGSPYYVRDGSPACDRDGQLIAKWELYRIPVRRPDAVIGTPNLRSGAAPPDHRRGPCRTAGSPTWSPASPWRGCASSAPPGLAAPKPRSPGSAARSASPHGEVVAIVVSTENRHGPRATNHRPASTSRSPARGDVGSSGVQINERSLRIIARELRLGERAEAYLRFPAGPQNLLAYRTLRVWIRGRGPGWEEGELQAFLKVGSDDRNFYLYRAPARTTTWEPEMRSWTSRPGGGSARTWRQRWLRARRPRARTSAAPTIPNAYVACEGALPRASRRSRHQSAQSRRGAGGLGRHLPGHRAWHCLRGGALGGRHPAEPIRSRRPVPPCRWTRGSSPRMWAA